MKLIIIKYKDNIFVLFIMSLSFIEHMREIANDKTLAQKIIDKQLEEKQNKFKEEQAKVKHGMFLKLTAKYYNFIIDAIKYASLNGKTYKYMNFCRDDFKANFPGVGNPVQIQEEWLNELCSDGSKYIPSYGTCLNGLQFTIWNNRSFTTVFNWDLSIHKKEQDIEINID